ncbi:replication initiation protein [Fusobacterium sp. OBRC1]|uniref:replication initiation protein n=1 Tax=Fusobacterium sp. OBRC1 TaxID=1032505 RepID=UPI00044ECFC4|nr:replication initiation protein [Fusobacterium sp. OBRC1]EUB35968.1 initiator RepB protein [Fusobacterium sp. OBRC1]
MKKNDIVKYNNDLNKLNMSTLKDKELELFYAICLELKEKGTDIITIDITEFRKEFNIPQVNKKRFNEYLENVQDKFLSLKYTLKTEKRIKKGTFFYDFDADLTTNKMIIRVNPEYSYILNGIVEYYTQFSFAEFQSLKSKYSRILMPKLAQWNSVKKLEIKKEELFDLLGVPQSYLKDISNFNKKVLKVLKEDLPNVFNNLKIKPIKNKIGNSKNQITSYLFTWSNKTEIKEAEEVKTLEISKKIKTLLDEAVKNPKLELLEKPSTIEYLLKHYEENIIILGIRQLLNSNVKTKIKTRKYITAVLDNIKEQENIKITVKEDKKNIETKKEIEEFKEKEKIEITADEYNKLLDEEIQNYIQEAKKLNQNINLEITKMSLRLKLNSKYKII